jgi:hypothetical protein
MDAMNPHEVSEADWADEVVDAPPAEGGGDPPSIDEAGDATAFRDDDSDERVAADEVARLAAEEAEGTGGSYPE